MQFSHQEAPLTVITYDISDNSERQKVDRLLHDYGFRVQKSVYECRLTRGGKKQLVARLEKLNIQTGHIRCYSVNGSRTLKIGADSHEIDNEPIYFIE